MDLAEIFEEVGIEISGRSDCFESADFLIAQRIKIPKF